MPNNFQKTTMVNSVIKRLITLVKTYWIKNFCWKISLNFLNIISVRELLQLLILTTIMQYFTNTKTVPVLQALKDLFIRFIWKNKFYLRLNNFQLSEALASTSAMQQQFFTSRNCNQSLWKGLQRNSFLGNSVSQIKFM